MRAARTGDGVDLGREVSGVDPGEHGLRLLAPVVELLVAELNKLHDAVSQVQSLDHETVLEVHFAGKPVERVFKPVIFLLRPVTGAYAPQDDLAVEHLGALVRLDHDAAVREIDCERLGFLKTAPGAGTHQRADQARGETPVVSGQGVVHGAAFPPDRFERRFGVGLGGIAFQARLRHPADEFIKAVMRAGEGGRLTGAAQPQHVRVKEAARAFLTKLETPIGKDPIRAVGDFDRLRPRGIGRQGNRRGRGRLVRQVQQRLGQER